jgi:imidazolonepropionase
MATCYRNIASLVSPAAAVGELIVITDAAMVVEDGKVSWLGKDSDAPSCETEVDLTGRTVIPGFVDSHSHLVFGGERSEEFASRMAGKKYQAGGINSTVAATRNATADELRANTAMLVQELYANGITTFEIKSGYGLDTETEKLSLEIASEFTEEVTFLGAHVVPSGSDPDQYTDLVAGEMLTSIKAKWVDVFCDKGAFSVTQARKVLTAGIAAGLKPRMHANQLSNIGAIALAVELDCASVDHCTFLDDDDIELLRNSNTVATLLPGAEFSTRSAYPQGGKLMKAGVAVAIATDCNPGSSFTTSMAFCIAVAVRDMGFSVDQAIWAATKGGAMALRGSQGLLEVGVKADFVVLDAPNHIYLAYRPGVAIISQTFLQGRKVYERR